MPAPGLELQTFCSEVQHANHYTTVPSGVNLTLFAYLDVKLHNSESIFKNKHVASEIYKSLHAYASRIQGCVTRSTLI